MIYILKHLLTTCEQNKYALCAPKHGQTHKNQEKCVQIFMLKEVKMVFICFRNSFQVYCFGVCLRV